MITYTFLGDGSSDKALMPIIDWVFRENFPTTPITSQFADLRFIRDKILPANRVVTALNYYPCDIIFIHRDGEDIKNTSAIYEKRKTEIAQLSNSISEPYVAVITIKMMETWLLTDATAIKKAAGNPNSPHKIELPSVKKLESEQSPKEKLHTLLKTASGLKGRRLDDFNVGQALHRVAELTADYSSLRNLFSFQKFEQDLIAATKKVLGEY